MADFFWIITIAMWIVAVFYAGVIYREWLLMRDIKRVLGNLHNLKDIQGKINDLENKVSQIKPVSTLKHEVINDTHYFFYEDDSFACQGATLEEAAQVFKTATNNEQVAEFVDTRDQKTYYFVEGKVHSAESAL
jgi:hypothetical protein